MKHHHSRRRGIALVITLLVIVVLTIAVTAFMQSMALERRTSQAYLNILRAEEAAAAGLQRVQNILAEKTATDDFIILRQPSIAGVPYYFIGKGRDSSGPLEPMNTAYTPLFSVVSSPGTNQPEIAPTAKGVDTSNNIPTIPTFAVPATGRPKLTTGATPVTTSWEVIPTGDKAIPNIRYSFWTEDEAGYVDASKAGNIDGAAQTHIRTDGSSPKDLALFTIFAPTLASDSGTTAARNAVMNRFLLITPESIAQIADYPTSPDLVSRAVASLSAGGRDFVEREIIPAGFGYKDAGKIKYNINDLIKQTFPQNVESIATVITDNLPKFNTASRKGSFPNNQDYVKTLAANMVDYADANTNGTVGADYRGVDSYPFLVTHYIRFRWRGANPNQFYASGGLWKVRVDVDIWIQLWNPSDKDIISGTWTLDDSGNAYSIYAGGGTETPLQPEPAGTAPRTITFNSTNILRKNEFKVFNFPIVTYECSTGISSSLTRPTVAAGGPRISIKTDGPNITHYNSNYRVLWNNIAIDRPGSDTAITGNRIERRNGTLNSESTVTGENTGTGASWRGFVPGLRYDFGESIYNLGDPRMAYYSSWWMSASDFDAQSTWYGRPYLYSTLNVQATPWLGGQTRPSSWPDGGYDTARGYSIYELLPGTTAAQERFRNNRIPSDIGASLRPAYDERAPSKISNLVEYNSILELGNIYDPAQWRPDWTPVESSPLTAKPASSEALQNAWKNLETRPLVVDPPLGTQPPLSSQYGIASSLRIGRGEFLTFDKEGIRSSQLLDLFTVNQNPTVTISGRININTASRDALRVLFAGIKIDRDPYLEPASLRGNLFTPNSSTTADAADIFADTIIANRPFLSLAKLSALRTSKDTSQDFPSTSKTSKIPLFGNKLLWPASQQPDGWLDWSREEIYAKSFNLMTVRSRNFIIYVTGQAISANGRVASEVTKKFRVFIEPYRLATGVIDTTKQPKVRVTYEKIP